MLNKIKDIKQGFLKSLERSSFLKLSPPGFDGISLYDSLAFFIASLMRGAINLRASSVSFKFFLALFPGVIFLFTLIPFILKFIPGLPEGNYVAFIMNQLQVLLPGDLFSVSRDTVFDILSREREGLLSLSFLLSLYFSTNGFNALINAFNHSIHISVKRSVYKQRLVSILLMFITLFLIILTISLFVFTKIGFDYLLSNNILEKGLTYYLIFAFEWIIQLLLIYFTISFMYYFAPANRKEWNFFSAGSTLSTLLTLLATYGFTQYITHFGNYNKLYGSIGTLLVFLVWINIISTILIIGFELNSSIQNAQKYKQSFQE